MTIEGRLLSSTAVVKRFRPKIASFFPSLPELSCRPFAVRILLTLCSVGKTTVMAIAEGEISSLADLGTEARRTTPVLFLPLMASPIYRPSLPLPYSPTSPSPVAFHFLFVLFPPFPSISLPFVQLGGLRERCKPSPQRGPGRSDTLPAFYLDGRKELPIHGTTFVCKTVRRSPFLNTFRSDSGGPCFGVDSNDVGTGAVARGRDWMMACSAGCQLQVVIPAAS